MRMWAAEIELCVLFIKQCNTRQLVEIIEMVCCANELNTLYGYFSARSTFPSLYSTVYGCSDNVRTTILFKCAVLCSH